MQIPQQIYFKQASPRGSKIIATIEGNDLPNIVQVKGTNDISPVKRKRERFRMLELSSGGSSRENDDDRRNDDDDDDEDFRDENGCHKNTVGVWESKCKYTTLKQTLFFIKKYRCKRVVLIGNYDAQGKLIIETPTSVVKDTSATFSPSDGSVELKWTSVTEILVREYVSEFKLQEPNAVWQQFDMDPSIGANTVYNAVHSPDTSGTIDYRVKTVFTNNTEQQILALSVNVNLNTNIADVTGFLVNYDGDTFVNVQWTSIQESALDYYKVEKMIPGGTTFIDSEIPNVTQQGASDYGPLQDLPNAGPGQYSYRLVAFFTDKTSVVAATFPPITV